MSFFVLLHQDITYFLYILVSFVFIPCGLVFTGTGVIMVSSSTKPDSGVIRIAGVSVVIKVFILKT